VIDRIQLAVVLELDDVFFVDVIASADVMPLEDVHYAYLQG
jgi:hypothetical protein